MEQTKEHLCRVSIFRHCGSLYHLLKIGQQVPSSHQPVPNLHPCSGPRLSVRLVSFRSHVDDLVLLEIRSRAKGVAAAAAAVQQQAGPGVCAQVDLCSDGPRGTHALP
ncbi:hypothetical protein EYF80_008762 [Liparis tanakae]|uniref:Uncharacterized protein n=1 Tax=Liparis tanakae TaxID=230148 RepID=A0A4Z2ITD0_9TELE|nr:hypothetical protein EYF80_008762 [Liparis tanakae]